MYNKRILIVRENPPEFKPSKFKGPMDVHAAFKHLSDLSQEEFHVIAADNRNNMIDSYMVSRGSLNGSMVHPRDVFKFAIEMNANAIILVHNHPSGDTNPSPEDVEITKRLFSCGELLGIKVLDHLIIGDGYNALSQTLPNLFKGD
jgi:DNA repair protein RadC